MADLALVLRMEEKENAGNTIYLSEWRKSKY